MQSGDLALFAPFSDGYADVSRSVAIAEAVRDRGTQVAFAGRGGVLTHLASGAGFEVIDLPSTDIASLRVFQGETPAQDAVEQAAEHVKAEVRLFADLSPAVVIGDCRPTLRISTHVANLPYVGIVGATWTTYFYGSRLSAPEGLVPRWARRLPAPLLEREVARRHRRGVGDPFREQWNRLAARFGTPPVAHAADLFRGQIGLVTDVKELLDATRFPADLPFIGPLVWPGEGDLPEIATRPRDVPLVYATFGSTGPDWVASTLVEALAAMPVTAVFTVGPHIDIASLPSASNVHIAAVAPGSEMAKLADLVICHGGIGSLYQAAAVGTPIIGIPGHFEQQWNIDLFQRWGCARRLPGRGLSAAEIKAAIHEVLDNPRYTRRAHDLQRVIERYDGPDTACLGLPGSRGSFGTVDVSVDCKPSTGDVNRILCSVCAHVLLKGPGLSVGLFRRNQDSVARHPLRSFP
ncbi:MAG: glycosyltransferase [Nocardioides sp.]|uniref:nucleotide disphospho-sugar-binding domain-containing protein n=1 Tax=Nocardioides sp. TaxID=35761 RepID=UPI0039E72465